MWDGKRDEEQVGAGRPKESVTYGRLSRTGEDTLLEETLYEEDLLPVCSPSLLAALGRPDGPADLDG